MSFSQRFGYRPIKDSIQIESMDEALRNGIWSLLKIHVWDGIERSTGVYSGYHLDDRGNAEMAALCRRLWLDYFKQPLDKLSNEWSRVLPQLREHFFGCAWHEAYDFVEFVASNYKRHGFLDRFASACNQLFEREMSAYRFIDGLVTRITDSQELGEIEDALNANRGPVSTHLRRALELLSDRNAPDYRNSIKESISAVEALVAKKVNADKGTLGQLIKKLEDDIGLHPALKTAFSNLYGYSVCSAFVNFVEGKTLTQG
jgi:hypothetical protein